MAEICLIIPPSAFLLDERVFPSLGILRVAASLESAGHHVDVVDLSGVSNYIEAVCDYVRSHSPLAYGITCTTPQFPAVTKIMGAIREFTATRIILGGPHITLSAAARKMERKKGIYGRAHYAMILLETLFDDRILVAGDGEISIHEAIKPDAKGLIDADDLKSEMFMSDTVYDESPEPARHLIDVNSYSYSIEGNRASSMIIQLGCPFGCGFCGGRNSKSLRVIRSRTADKIIAEIRHVYERYGYTGLMFYDDELNVNPKLVDLMNKISDLQDELGVEFRLRGFVKAELFTDEQAEAMYRAGFRWLLCGFESADPRILVNINKRATLEDNTRAVEIAKRNGLKIKALMSIGHPGETEESVNSVKEWLVKMRVDDFDCTVISAYPGTPYYDEAVPTESGVWTYTQPKTEDRLHMMEIDYASAADYYKGIPGGGYKSYVYTDHLSSERIVELRDDLEIEVRKALNIPFNSASPALRYEHSPGGHLPHFVLRQQQSI